MSPLAAILLLALAAPAGGGLDDPDPGHYPGATEVLKSTFEPTGDEDFYVWPPGWTRTLGPGYPRYVRPRIDDRERPPLGGRCLRVDLNGAGASAFGPPIAIEPGLNYVLEGYIKTSALRHDAAWLSLTFKGAARAKLAEAPSEKIDGTSSWRKVRVGPVTPPPGASMLFIGIHLAPKGEDQDLHGTAWFGSLWVGRLPRIALTVGTIDPRSGSAASFKETSAVTRAQTDSSFLVFTRHPQAGSWQAGAEQDDHGGPSKRGAPAASTPSLEVDCQVSGFAAPKYDVRLELQDASGHMIARHEERFSTAQPRPATTKAKSNAEGAKDAVASHGSSFARATWPIPVGTAGYYRVRAEVVPLSLRERVGEREDLSSAEAQAAPLRPASEGSCLTATCTAAVGLAIVDRQPVPPDSEFGWSLDPGDDAQGLVPLADLLTQSGIRWVKFPFVCSLQEARSANEAVGSTPRLRVGLQSFQPTTRPELPAAPDTVDPLINFSDRLSRGGMQIAGVLLPPREPGRPGAALLAAEAFALDPKVWYPSLEPILARLGTEIRCWQIGDDRDASWIGCGGLPAAV